jgi:hypothetical protein
MAIVAARAGAQQVFDIEYLIVETTSDLIDSYEPEGEWVENVVLDLSKGSGEPEDMWQWIRTAVLQQWNLALGAQLVTIGMLWMSPLCSTFSNADASNRLKGCMDLAQTSAAGHRQCVWETSEAGRCISAAVDSVGGFTVNCVPWAGLVSGEPSGQLGEETIHGTVLRRLGFGSSDDPLLCLRACNLRIKQA